MQNQKESLNFLTRNGERGFRKFDSKTEAGKGKEMNHLLHELL